MTYYTPADSKKVLLNGYGENVAFIKIRHLLSGGHKPEPFHISTKNLRGSYNTSYSDILSKKSWLPEAYRTRLMAALNRFGVGNVYVIYSFDTPIAWQNGNHWVVPNVRYSQRTSRHQTTIRAALGKEYGEE